MTTLKFLFTTDYGLMSLGVIVFVILMGAWLARFVRRNIEQDARKAKA